MYQESQPNSGLNSNLGQGEREGVVINAVYYHGDKPAVKMAKVTLNKNSQPKTFSLYHPTNYPTGEVYKFLGIYLALKTSTGILCFVDKGENLVVEPFIYHPNKLSIQFQKVTDI